jgi:chromosome segregation ATPase
MPPMEWMLEIVLVGMLGVTLFHAMRLERALGVLKRDRATLEALVAGFNDSTRQAEQGIERLRATADGAGRQIARQAEAATALKDDLGYLTERGEQIADRLDGLVRSARPLAAQPAVAERIETAEPRPRSQAERDLIKALRMAR